MYRVIIAEDEDIIRKGLVYSMPWEKMGCAVVGEARNGVEGVELIRNQKPDIALVDINMPVMDGLQMIEETYGEYDYSAILLSGYSSFAYAQRAIRCGVTDYLLKPLKQEELAEAVKEAQEKCEIRRSWIASRAQRQEWREKNLLAVSGVRQQDDVVQAMLDFIANRYREKLVLQDVVNELNYSESFLNKRFKKEMGTTFIEYLNRFRIQKAMELLKEGTIPVQDISWMCGIGDYKYFNIVFKKYIGCSPKEYGVMVRERAD